MPCRNGSPGLMREQRENGLLPEWEYAIIGLANQMKSNEIKSGKEIKNDSK